MTATRVARSVVGAALMTVVFSSAALAYQGEVAGQVVVNGPTGAITCGADVAIAATVLDGTGDPIDAHTVEWSFDQSETGDVLDSSTSITDANGAATTTVRLACVPGQRTIRATADHSFATVVVDVAAVGLPRTSTEPASAPPGAMILAALAVIVGAGLATRQARPNR